MVEVVGSIPIVPTSFVPDRYGPVFSSGLW